MEPLSATVRCTHVVWTVATYLLPIGNWLTASEPPLYDFWYLNYFLITLAISLCSRIFNKVVEAYFSPVLVQKQLSSQVIKTPTSACASHKNWTSVPFHCEEGICLALVKVHHSEKCPKYRDSRYKVTAYGAGKRYCHTKHVPLFLHCDFQSNFIQKPQNKALQKVSRNSRFWTTLNEIQQWKQSLLVLQEKNFLQAQ